MRADREKNIKLWSWLLAVLLALIMLYGCTTTKYVPVNQIRHDIEYRNIIMHDSIYIYDSERVVNDTVYITRYKYNGTYRNDTVYVNTTDSVPYPVEVEVLREVVPTWCWWSLAITGLMIGSFAMMIIGKIKR